MNQASHWDEILVTSTSFILGITKHGKIHSVSLNLIMKQNQSTWQTRTEYM